MGGGPSQEVGGGKGDCCLEDARRRVELARSALPGAVLVAATEILRVAGVPAYHTSVILGDKEYYFDSQGVIAAPPLWSHFLGQSKRPQEFRTEVINCGASLHTGVKLVQSLQVFFEKGSYDVLHKNCNAFTDAALYFLTRRRLDGRFSRLERMLVATEPWSTEVLNRILMADPPKDPPPGATAGRLWPGPYFVNPRAENFSVSQVIAACDMLNAAEVGPRSSERVVCGCINGWNCANPSAVDVRGQHEEGTESAMTIEAGDIVDVNETITVTRPASWLAATQQEEMNYWEFELDDEGPLVEAENSMVQRTTTPHQAIDEEEHLPLRDIGNRQPTPRFKSWDQQPLKEFDGLPRRCTSWRAHSLPRGKSLDGASLMEDLERGSSVRPLQRSASRGRPRHSRSVPT